MDFTAEDWFSCCQRVCGGLDFAMGSMLVCSPSADLEGYRVRLFNLTQLHLSVARHQFCYESCVPAFSKSFWFQRKPFRPEVGVVVSVSTNSSFSLKKVFSRPLCHNCRSQFVEKVEFMDNKSWKCEILFSCKSLSQKIFFWLAGANI